MRLAAVINPRQRFNPLPSPKQGETIWRLAILQRPVGRSGFNPLPSPKQGETYPKSASCCDRSLVINCKSKEASQLVCPLFQSAPLTEARGDQIRLCRRSASRSLFQSAPLTEARGDGRVRYLAIETHRSRVSIRSPHRSKGRRECRSTGR